MLTGLSVTCTGYVFMGSLFERWPDATNRGAGIWLVICIFAIQCAYAGAMGPIAYLIGTEIWPQPLREFGISVSFLCLFLSVIVVNQIWPVLTDSIRFRLYWVMLGFNVVSLVSLGLRQSLNVPLLTRDCPTAHFIPQCLVYAFWPETKGRSLEQMDSLFGEVDVLARVSLGNAEDGNLAVYTASEDDSEVDSHGVSRKPMPIEAQMKTSDHGASQLR